MKQLHFPKDVEERWGVEENMLKWIQDKEKCFDASENTKEKEDNLVWLVNCPECRKCIYEAAVQIYQSSVGQKRTVICRQKC